MRARSAPRSPSPSTAALVACSALALPDRAVGRRLATPGRGRATDDASCETYLADTWRSMDAMTDPATGLPADNIGGDLAAGTPQRRTPRRPTSAPTCGAPSPPATPA